MPLLAQDGYNQTEDYYKEIYNKTHNITQYEARLLIGELVSNLDLHYGYIKSQASENSVSILYQLVTESAVYSSRLNETNLVFWFSKDYTLQKIQGEKSTMFQLWNEFFFKGNSNYKQIENNYKYRLIVSKSLNLHYQLVKNEFWVIEDRSKL
jgi:hypothetical protein